ncbi:Membrane magnesium transporter 1 [Allomyces javanicus]|nr:Membrane magnesium transporter 1 [Allomyces javanicus]
MSPAPSSAIGRAVLILGLLVLCHAAYSAFEHVSYLKTIDRVDDGLTLDIILEALLAMVVSTVGILLVADPLQDISLENELKQKTRHAFESRPSFRSFGHRGPHFAALLNAASASGAGATRS